MAPTIHEHLKSCPAGFLGALKRMGDRIEPSPGFYLALHEIFNDRDHRDVAKALQRASQLDMATLAVARGMSPMMLRAGALKIVNSTRARDDLEASIEYFLAMCPTATKPAISESLRAAADRGDLTSFIHRWLRHATFPNSPRHPDSRIVAIGSGQELVRTARGFQNCLGSFLLDVLSGTEAFYTAETPVGVVIVRLGRCEKAAPWKLLGSHGKRNRMVPALASEWVARKFAAVGIQQERYERPRAPELQPIERLLEPFFYDDLNECLPG
jgi:hypothetical protein